LYYIFETGLFVLIIVFAQEAGEIWFKKSTIPWGGILVSLTWGLAHILAKGDLSVGLIAFIGVLLYGSIYIISKNNLFIVFPFIF
jgi:membrane protease YdiL (CAAX protease family)